MAALVPRLESQEQGSSGISFRTRYDSVVPTLLGGCQRSCGRQGRTSTSSCRALSWLALGGSSIARTMLGAALHVQRGLRGPRRPVMQAEASSNSPPGGAPCPLRQARRPELQVEQR